MTKDEMVREVVKRIMNEVSLQRINYMDDSDYLEEIENILGYGSVNPKDLLDGVKDGVNKLWYTLNYVVENY
mgnify:CR=1 FL=1|jgi:hypothetical protein